MSKLKTVFICSSCGANHGKWQGQCSVCGEWNTLTEEIVDKRAATASQSAMPVTPASKPRPLVEIDSIEEKRILVPDAEMNRVLGGGIVLGSIILLGGEPGIGKSTLLLQVALQLNGLKTLYVSGEESERQIKMRADRIASVNPDLYIVAETSMEKIIHSFHELKPELLIIDSIQTVYTEELDSAPGSVSQVRECASRFMRLAKQSQVPVFLVGHITKEGHLAGPKVLEHTVDAVLTFEGDRHHNFRVVRTVKNRFGSTLELGIYEMHSGGLREVNNPSEIFLSTGDEEFSGVAISATMEGLRPLLIETQALVTPMAYGVAQRSATGFDLRRLNMLLAVLEKRCGFKMGTKDVFINMAGGIRVDDPALDLGLILAVISSAHDLPIDKTRVFAAEVGLAGELRAVQRIEQRISEAEKLGFKEIYLSSRQLKGLEGKFKNIKIKGFSRLEEVFKEVFS
ncbi:MAG: DNA repair protein RadA [Bacteroidia bacterium]|nr:DNA repair protein RadA [Bacteroidia bacterium]